MSDSLGDLLARKDFDEPSEILAIKSFVLETFQAQAEVMMREREIIITVTSAPLANNLRLRVNQIREAAQTDKRLVFRIR